MASEKDIVDALRLEDLEFIEVAKSAAAKAQSDIRAMKIDMAARGGAIAASQLIRQEEIRFNQMNATIDTAIAKRSQLGQRLPELLTPARLSALQSRLYQSIDNLLQNQHDEQGRNYGGVPGAILQSLNQIAKQKADQLRGRVVYAIEKLSLEANLGLIEGPQSMTFNISHSTIANLNLGTVVGDLMASVKVLHQEGKPDLGRDIQALTEALASAKIPDDERRDLLEHLSVVSSEVTLPPEKQKKAPLRMSIEALQKGLTIAGQLVALWKPIEEILKSMGLLPKS